MGCGAAEATGFWDLFCHKFSNFTFVFLSSVFCQVLALVAHVCCCLFFVCLEFQIIRFVISTFTPIFFIEISFVLLPPPSPGSTQPDDLGGCIGP